MGSLSGCGYRTCGRSQKGDNTLATRYFGEVNDDGHHPDLSAYRARANDLLMHGAWPSLWAALKAGAAAVGVTVPVLAILNYQSPVGSREIVLAAILNAAFIAASWAVAEFARLSQLSGCLQELLRNERNYDALISDARRERDAATAELQGQRLAVTVAQVVPVLVRRELDQAAAEVRPPSNNNAASQRRASKE